LDDVIEPDEFFFCDGPPFTEYGTVCTRGNNSKRNRVVIRSLGLLRRYGSPLPILARLRRTVRWMMVQTMSPTR